MAPAMAGANAASSKEPSINERIRNLVADANESCARAEEFLNRVAPRPPKEIAAVAATPGNRLSAPDQLPSMVANMSEFEMVVERLRRIVVELPRIA